MDLSQLANLGEFVGGIAVIVSLVYLAVQVRRNTQEVRRSNARQTTAMNASVLHMMVRHAGDSTGVNFGFGSLDERSEEERLRHEFMWASWLQGVEQILADVREGLQDPEYGVPYKGLLRQILGGPGGTEWWEAHRGWFSASFQAEVDALRPRSGG